MKAKKLQRFFLETITWSQFRTTTFRQFSTISSYLYKSLPGIVYKLTVHTRPNSASVL